MSRQAMRRFLNDRFQRGNYGFTVRISPNHVSRNIFLMFHGSRKILYHGFTVDISPNHVSRNGFLLFHGSRTIAVSRIHGQKIVNSRIHGKFTEEKWLITDSRNPLSPPLYVCLCLCLCLYLCFFCVCIWLYLRGGGKGFP